MPKSSRLYYLGSLSLLAVLRARFFLGLLFASLEHVVGEVEAGRHR